MQGLTDKTILIAGPFGSLMQNLTSRLSEAGADVCIVTDDMKSAQRVCQNLNDMREVSEKYGRTAALEAQFKNEKDIGNMFSRTAEMFGSADVYIDTHLTNLPLPYYTDAKKEDLEKEFYPRLEKLRRMTAVATTYMKSRTRGRVLYLYHELDAWAAQHCDSPVFEEFKSYIQTTAKQFAAQQTAVNALAIGISEEYLLAHFAKKMTIQMAIKEVAKTIPNAKLVDYGEIGNFTAFLASPQSSGLSGQIIAVDHAMSAAPIAVPLEIVNSPATSA